MKNDSIRHRIAIRLLCCTCLAGMWAPVQTAAQNNTSRSNRSSTSTGTQSNRSGAATEQVRVTRATNYMGFDVQSTDGRKVGDIVDYYFDLGEGRNHLAYVVIMTGGFLDMGGDTRAVPASAISVSGDNCRINISSDRFWDVPVLPENRQRFISDPQHQQRLSQLFSESANRTASADTNAAAGGTAASDTGSSASNTAGSATATASAGMASDDPNQPGSMTGRATGERRLVSFNQLRNADAYGQQDNRLGFFMDAWINLNENRAPYVEITPTFLPFRTNFDQRYAIPTAKITQKREYYGYNVAVTTDELNQAKAVSETEGVKMLQEGRFENAVLRVTVPER